MKMHASINTPTKFRDAFHSSSHCRAAHFNNSSLDAIFHFLEDLTSDEILSSIDLTDVICEEFTPYNSLRHYNLVQHMSYDYAQPYPITSLEMLREKDYTVLEVADSNEFILFEM